MTNMTELKTDASRLRTRRQTIALSLLILFGMTAVVSLARLIEARRPPVDAQVEEERLYVTGKTAERLSLSFRGLVADWYWMRSLQYVGRRLFAHTGAIQLDDLSTLNLKLLYPLLDTTTTLDPQYMAAYEYGAFVLPGVNSDSSIALVKKGIAANPDSWQLYQHLGYIYWRRGEYQLSSEAYGAGARLAGAPSWMPEMSARMAAEGGSRDIAREMYRRIYDETTDTQVKRQVELRLLQIASFDERDTIRRIINEYQKLAGRCPSSWKEIAPALQAARLRIDAATSAPVDPTDAPYKLINNGCDVDLGPKSQIPLK